MCAYYSKACRLSETIQTEIQQGRLFNNPYFPSEIKLAARYCASRHTVRRILAKLTDDGILIRMDNGRVKISPSVEENISINPGKIKLAWIYAAYPDSTIAEVTAGIVDFAEKNEVDLQIINSTSGHQEVLQLLPHIKQLGFDGAMILSYEIPEYAACLNQLVREHFPVVTFGPTYGSNCSSVSTDDFGSTFQAVRDLIQRYDRPVYFIGACEGGSATERYHAYCRAMLDAGADLVQLYTGYIYEGPGLVGEICRALIADEERRRAEAAKTEAEQEAALNNMTSAAQGFIADAEKLYEDYTKQLIGTGTPVTTSVKSGALKKDSVMAKLSQYALEKGYVFDSEYWSKAIDELVALTKNVNVK